MKIGLVGYGYLGKAFDYAFRPKCEVKINDIAYMADGVKFFKKADLMDSDLIIVAVPTPYSKSRGFDASTLESVLSELNESNKGENLSVCIKSAVLPSYCKKFREAYPNLEISYSPEYLSGKDNIRDMVNHEALIVGSDTEFEARFIINCFVEHSVANKDVKTGICTPEEACLIKYMENCFLAMKCVFMSEFYQMHKTFNSHNEFNDVIKLWQLDSRMGNYPYKIPYFGELGFDSHCLVKDTFAIKREFDRLGIPYNLGSANIDTNLILRSDLADPFWRCNSTTGGLIE